MNVHPKYIVVCPAGRTWHCESTEEVKSVLMWQDNPEKFAVYYKADLSDPNKKKESK